jgi:hypothetical protein
MEIQVKRHARRGMSHHHRNLSLTPLPANQKPNRRDFVSVPEINHVILADRASDGRAWLWALVVLGLIVVVLPLVYSAFRAGESVAISETGNGGAVAPASALGVERVGQLLPGWAQAGDNFTDYVTGTQQSVPGYDSDAMFIRSTKTIPQGFSTVMKSVPATAYLGKRVTLTGTIRTEDVIDRVGMWLRIDGPDNAPLGFDNMQDRPIKGTSEAREYTITMEVPANAQNMSYGVMLTSAGKVWFDEMQLGS